MHRCLFALTMAFAAGASVAQQEEGDPLRSAACQRALEALQAEEAATAAEPGAAWPPAGAVPGASRGRLETLRRRAAHACLGARADPPASPQRFAQPPVSVPPVAPPATLPPPLPPPEVPPPGRPGPPLILMGCDATGCWASDGTRLHRAGPELLGPRGFCALNAGILQCP